MLGGVVCSTLRTFLADNAGIGLPLGIERVIGIGSNGVFLKKLKKWSITTEFNSRYRKFGFCQVDYGNNCTKVWRDFDC